MEPMTLDDLIAECQKLKVRYIPMDFDDYDKKFNEGIFTVLDYIRDNRPALESGMRGTLRFKRFDDPYSSNRPEYYALLALDGLPISRHEYHHEEALVSSFDDKAQCQLFAESLGFHAEFVEPDDEPAT